MHAYLFPYQCWHEWSTPCQKYALLYLNPACLRPHFSQHFFGFVRIGEFAANSKHNVQPSVLKLTDVNIGTPSTDHVTLSFPRSKNNQRGPPQSVCLQRALDIHSATCPVKALTTYAEVRPSYPGPFFCHYDGSPLTRYHYSMQF